MSEQVTYVSVRAPANNNDDTCEVPINYHSTYVYLLNLLNDASGGTTLIRRLQFTVKRQPSVFRY